MENTSHIQIFLVDDDEDDALIFKETLADCSFQSRLTLFSLCQDVCRHILSDSTIVPDIIFLDINMPLMNGIDCLAEIRKNRKFDRVPVVMFSTSVRETDIEETYRYGANLYLNKPFSIELQKLMLEVVIRLLREGQLFNRTRENYMLKHNWFNS